VAARKQDLVLVVDDDSDFRALVRTLLERAAFRVEEAVNGEETLAAVERELPRLVLLDVVLPEMSGYEIYRELRERCGSTFPVIFVSGERTDALDRSTGLLLGADDYVVKPFDPGELIARVRRSLRQRGNGGASAAAEPFADPGLDDLTPREREVLALLSAGRSTKQIAQELGITRRTLGSHVQHILSKLGVSSRTQAVVLAHRAGLDRHPA
jgi:DNA-binding NarL/FixJ family response regulator